MNCDIIATEALVHPRDALGLGWPSKWSRLRQGGWAFVSSRLFPGIVSVLGLGSPVWPRATAERASAVCISGLLIAGE